MIAGNAAIAALVEKLGVGNAAFIALKRKLRVFDL
jgi:hypothetical protein